MQFTKPEVPDVDEEMEKLREAVAAEAPFDFVKMSHHASDNGFSEKLFNQWKNEENDGEKTVRFGISAEVATQRIPTPPC